MSGRVGLELELLAPAGSSRRVLAERAARALEGRLVFGLKYHSPGLAPDGRPVCALSCAYRVLDARGRTVATLVDDPTLTVPAGRAGRGGAYAGVADDVRLALLAEKLCWAPDDSPAAVYAQLARAFHGEVEPAGPRDGWGAVVDAHGHALVRAAAGDGRRERACEVVLAPVPLGEVARAVEPWLSAARRAGFSIPREAALHSHFDAAPFRRTARLKGVILRWADEREAWWHALAPNPRCTQLGPPPPDVVRVARAAEPTLPFSTFAAALLLAGAKKACDLNLLGVLERRPRQPTLEVRCLPMSLLPEAVQASVERAAELLA